jgi:plasmid stabilization system protein ParE
VKQARFLKPAELEVEEAVAYFDQQRPGLGDRFERDLRATIGLLLDHPHSGKSITKAVRKFPLRTFRYNVVYVIDGNEVVVVAVAHHKRRPRYWRRRLAELA